MLPSKQPPPQAHAAQPRTWCPAFPAASMCGAAGLNLMLHTLARTGSVRRGTGASHIPHTCTAQRQQSTNTITYVMSCSVWHQQTHASRAYAKHIRHNGTTNGKFSTSSSSGAPPNICTTNHTAHCVATLLSRVLRMQICMALSR